tara:strand:+ start:733 stop:1071 length:339 start_codon:yes stop_codon:yes gene_type:complete
MLSESDDEPVVDDLGDVAVCALPPSLSPSSFTCSPRRRLTSSAPRLSLRVNIQVTVNAPVDVPVVDVATVAPLDAATVAPLAVHGSRGLCCEHGCNSLAQKRGLCGWHAAGP